MSQRLEQCSRSQELEPPETGRGEERVLGAVAGNVTLPTPRFQPFGSQNCDVK